MNLIDEDIADTKLGDRTATLDRALISYRSPAEAELTMTPNRQAGATKPQLQVPGDSESLFRIRHDLSEAQRSKGEMQARLQILTEELQNLKMQAKVDGKRINDLTTERTALVIRIRDRDEELRGKAKLLVVSFLFFLTRLLDGLRGRGC